MHDLLSDTAARALFISAPASGQGKTLLTAALARRARLRGWQVRVFKTGADFIDPMILGRASGAPVFQLDLWMGGEQHCRQLLHAAAARAQLILIEGAMGLYDGAPCSADLAQLFDIPVLAVIDANAMAQTFGALAAGLRQYRPALKFHGVIANRVAGVAHARMLADSLPAQILWLGALPHDAQLAIADRHLGLLLAAEITDLDARLDHAAALLADFDQQLERLAPTVFQAGTHDELTSERLQGVRIAIARDQAFCFLYEANLQLLRDLGAQLIFFSPLQDATLPAADAIYLPGGYPELFASQLAANLPCHRHLREHAAAGLPLLAECGGMMLLLQSLVDLNGCEHRMAGVLPGSTQMQATLQSLSMQSVRFDSGALRGHSFHYSRLHTELRPALRALTSAGGGGEAVFQSGRLTASYLHFYGPSNPSAFASLFRPGAPVADASSA